MNKVEAYKSSDGKLFETEFSCQEHEISLAWLSRISGFQSSEFNPYNNDARSKGMAAKIIVAWEMYKGQAVL